MNAKNSIEMYDIWENSLSKEIEKHSKTIWVKNDYNALSMNKTNEKIELLKNETKKCKNEYIDTQKNNQSDILNKKNDYIKAMDDLRKEYDEQWKKATLEKINKIKNEGSGVNNFGNSENKS